MTFGLRGAIALLLAILLAGAGWKLYLTGKKAGMAEVQQRWDRQVAEAEQAVRTEEERQQKVITKTVTKFVERAAQERVVYRDIIREVPKYVPSDLPMLPADFRVLHDAAATGSALPKADDPARIAAATVSPQDIATTVADNDADCRYDQARLKSLQDLLHNLNAR